MNRTLVGIGLVLLLVISLGVVVMAYLAFGSDGDGERTVLGANLSGPGAITFRSGYDIEAVDETDAYYLLGYAQGIERPWVLNLLRQTALGRLGEWFGAGVLPVDRLTRSLALASGARTALDALPDDDRRMLRFYARGVSDAFETRRVIMNEQLVLFDIAPEPWEAWHSMAIERLLAWLSEPPVRPARDDTAFAALTALERADVSLREWLHLHGFDHSATWAFDDSSGSTVQAQYVYGATTLPLIEPARLSWPDVSVSGASLLGTPFFPFSAGPGGVNVVLLSSPRRVRNRFAAGYPDSVATEQRHERLVLASGEEALLTVPFLDDVVFFSPGSFMGDRSADRLWGTVEWTGINQASDWPAWRNRLLQSAGASYGAEPPFELIQGDGLSVSPSGEKTVRGLPDVVERSVSGSIYVAIHPLGRYPAERFDRQVRSQAFSALSTDITSTWAERNLPTALAALRPDSAYSPAIREAIDYLRNWDYRYNLASIGATIFDSWMGSFTDYEDPYPIVEVGSDSLTKALTRFRLEEALATTVDSLTSVAGPDPARWRLESFRTGGRFSPVWSFRPLEGSLPPVDPLRFAPLSIREPGHPTTIAWESGLFDYPFNSPAHVLVTAGPAGAPPFSFRPDYRIGTGVIARHVVSAPEDHPPPFLEVEPSARLTFRPGR